jgi:glycosyltransferase involved in cell wall biosynthesis
MAEISQLRIAVVVPCYNEAATIAHVVRDFRCHLPSAEIYAFNNNSTDDTGAAARAAGAQVIDVPLQGKGNVVRRMFADVEADVYVMVDGRRDLRCRRRAGADRSARRKPPRHGRVLASE